MFPYRPWGNIDWLLPKLSIIDRWSFLGCLSPEYRFSEAFKQLDLLSKIEKSTFILVKDPPSSLSDKIDYILNNHILMINDLDASKKVKPEIPESALLYNDSEIYSFVEEFVSQSNGNIVLDISCFPKRFFFALIKWIYKNPSVHNFIVTNTSPAKYRSGNLAEDYGIWETLPFFSEPEPENDAKDKVAFLGVGHMPMASPEHIKDIATSSKLYLLFPFPGHPASFLHTWKFVFCIKPNIQQSNCTISHINASDVSETYDTLT